MRLLITGADGFIGKNIRAWVRNQDDIMVIPITRESSHEELQRELVAADAVIHLAGVNRPQQTNEFQTENVGFTAKICQQLQENNRPIPIVFTSSTQATRDNPYGVSKAAAERVLANHHAATGAPVTIFRLPNVFGKWCRPNYNSVVATFCHNIARDQVITVSDPANVVTLVHVDDVVRALLEHAAGPTRPILIHAEAGPTYTCTLGRLVETLRGFRAIRDKGIVPDLDDPFVHRLYSTYLSYLDEECFAYDLQQHTDPRGSLAEFVKAPGFGQIFVSRTKPGITRGNHYHHVKTEKFLVLEGEAIVRFRHILHDSVIEYPVRGDEYRVIDIPPGYTHSIENISDSELVTLFWASEIFDPKQPDTVYLDVHSTDR